MTRATPRYREPLFTLLIDELTMRTTKRRSDSIIQLVDRTRIRIKLAHMWGSDALVNRAVLDARKALIDLGRTERYAHPRPVRGHRRVPRAGSSPASLQVRGHCVEDVQEQN